MLMFSVPLLVEPLVELCIDKPLDDNSLIDQFNW